MQIAAIGDRMCNKAYIALLMIVASCTRSLTLEVRDGRTSSPLAGVAVRHIAVSHDALSGNRRIQSLDIPLTNEKGLTWIQGMRISFTEHRIMLAKSGYSSAVIILIKTGQGWQASVYSPERTTGKGDRNPPQQYNPVPDTLLVPMIEDKAQQARPGD